MTDGGATHWPMSWAANNGLLGSEGLSFSWSPNGARKRMRFSNKALIPCLFLSPCYPRWQKGGLERALAERNADQTVRDTRRFGVSSKGCRPKEQTAVADTDAPQKQTKKKSDKDKPKENLSSTAPEAQEALLGLQIQSSEVEWFGAVQRNASNSF